MKKLLIGLLLTTSILSGCSKDIEIKQASDLYKEFNGVVYNNHNITDKEFKIIEKCLKDKDFKNIIKDCGIKEMVIYVGSYKNNKNNHGNVYFIDCYINTDELSLSELNLVMNLNDNDRIDELQELINFRLGGLTTSIDFRDKKDIN